MKHTAIEKHIEIIVDAADDNLFYICTRTNHMSTNQNFPVIIAYAQTSGLQDWEGIENKTARTFDVTMLMLEHAPKPALVDDGKGGKTRESEESYQKRRASRREEMIDIFEQIIEFLTADEYGFRYEVLTDIIFQPHDEEENTWGLFGEMCSFSVASGYVKRKCCIDFDDGKIKNANKKVC